MCHGKIRKHLSVVFVTLEEFTWLHDSWNERVMKEFTRLADDSWKMAHRGVWRRLRDHTLWKSSLGNLTTVERWYTVACDDSWKIARYERVHAITWRQLKDSTLWQVDSGHVLTESNEERLLQEWRAPVAYTMLHLSGRLRLRPPLSIAAGGWLRMIRTTW